MTLKSHISVKLLGQFPDFVNFRSCLTYLVIRREQKSYGYQYSGKLEMIVKSKNIEIHGKKDNPWPPRRPWYSLGFLSHGSLSGGSVLVGASGKPADLSGWVGAKEPWVFIFHIFPCSIGSQLELRTEFPNHMKVNEFP